MFLHRTFAGGVEFCGQRAFGNGERRMALSREARKNRFAADAGLIGWLWLGSVQSFPAMPAAVKAAAA